MPEFHCILTNRGHLFRQYCKYRQRRAVRDEMPRYRAQRQNSGDRRYDGARGAAVDFRERRDMACLAEKTGRFRTFRVESARARGRFAGISARSDGDREAARGQSARASAAADFHPRRCTAARL